MNPGSRSGRGRRLWDVWESGLRRAGVAYERTVTTGPGEALRISRESRDIDAVVAVGGDGTINKVLDGPCVLLPGFYSGLRIELYADRVPLARGVWEASAAASIPAEAALVGGAGEYELLFATPRELDQTAATALASAGATPIADVTPAGDGVHILRNGRPIAAMTAPPPDPVPPRARRTTCGPLSAPPPRGSVTRQRGTPDRFICKTTCGEAIQSYSCARSPSRSFSAMRFCTSHAGPQQRLGAPPSALWLRSCPSYPVLISLLP